MCFSPFLTLSIDTASTVVVVGPFPYIRIQKQGLPKQAPVQQVRRIDPRRSRGQRSGRTVIALSCTEDESGLSQEALMRTLSWGTRIERPIHPRCNVSIHQSTYLSPEPWGGVGVRKNAT